MGEVYRAVDTKLKRQVAIKTLPSALDVDVDRLARLRREAEVLASLNHSHIAGVYGLEESNGVTALVMELVEGEDLSQRIARGPIPLDEALPIAKQIAEALEAAHELGIIHRDLKPANIKVRADGTVKVLDFGLAKTIDSVFQTGIAGMNSPTLSVHATRAGLIVGTPAYMSPEQARGLAIDRRTDIWAFGVVMFEMLCGDRLFAGPTNSDTLSAVLTTSPNWSLLPVLPSSLRRLLVRCLEKDPKRRLQAIGEARFQIEEMLAGSPDNSQTAATGHGRRLHERLVPWVSGGTACILSVLLALWSPWRREVRRPADPLRLSVELGADVSLANTNLGAATILSPDGHTLAFVAQEVGGTPRIYLRRLDAVQAVPLSGTEQAASPFFSPDGQWIAFFAVGKLRKIAVTGGTAVELCDAPNGRGGTWAPDGRIIFTPDSSMVSLWSVSTSGGKSTPFTKLAEGEFQQKWPQVLPGGKGVLFTSHTSPNKFDDAQLVVQSLTTGARKVVHRGGYYGRYVGSGHLVYLAHGTLFAALFDLERLEMRGTPAPVVDGVMANPAVTGGAQFDVAETGTLVYVPGPSLNAEIPIDWMRRDGTTARLRAAATNWGDLRFSPDGQQLAMDVFDGKSDDVWIYNWPHDSLSRLMVDPDGIGHPVWTPDGRYIVFASARGDKTSDNLYWQKADGTGDAKRLTVAPNDQVAGSWHPSGKFLAFTERNPQTGTDVMILPFQDDVERGRQPGTPTVFLNSSFGEQAPAFSPDGRWLAYVSDETGRNEVYVRPFPGPGRKWAVSTGGATGAVWSRRSHDLLFGTVDGRIMVVSYVAAGDSFLVGKPELWSSGRFAHRRPGSWSGEVSAGFDLHPDGERVALASFSEDQATGKPDHARFVFNFFDELRRRVPAGK